ncbi:unnamed protein product [Dracunculus medinensis]|uniref:C2H2-type domain-containing protein n=1 Tax=Dracunculus medinensis TaxID=318479 RepID=A0A0N4UQ12_DRAME|nr:unnamed protein product [Dracunculus medinensis]
MNSPTIRLKMMKTLVNVFIDHNDDRRYKCPVEGCNKRYKNLQGAKHHARQVHGINDDSVGVVTSIDILPRPGNTSVGPAQPPVTKYASMRPYKCAHCTKRYKTMVGLSNHMQQGHQRLSIPTSTTNLTTNLVPVSPSAVSNSTSTHLHTQSGAQESHNSIGSLREEAQNPTQVNVCIASPYNSSTAPMNVIPPGMRVTAQTMSSVIGHQYQNQIYPSNKGASVHGTNIQVRTVGNVLGISRTTPLPYQVPVATNDVSQQVDAQIPNKVPQRVTSNQTSLNRSHYQQFNQAYLQRARMSSNHSSSSINVQYNNDIPLNTSSNSDSQGISGQSGRVQQF